MAVGGWLGGFAFDVTGAYRDAFAAGLLFNLMNLVIVGTLLIKETPSLRHADV